MRQPVPITSHATSLVRVHCDPPLSKVVRLGGTGRRIYFVSEVSDMKRYDAIGFVLGSNGRLVVMDDLKTGTQVVARWADYAAGVFDELLSVE